MKIHPVRLLTYGVVGVRVIVAGMFAFAPQSTMAKLFGSNGTSRRSRAIAAAYAARDLTLGAGLLLALAKRRDEKMWMAAGTACDVADLAGIIATGGKPGQWRMVAGMLGIIATDTVLTAKVEQTR
ncbi:hypothetical protein LZG04_03855 [Saccharothrix sp. S26]|uniref:DUF4267 domain-containing protein n=1 Tax=Saccharothrix sp. S26 TaxID=2907215 RepID=UPI001F47A769|nr:DUF4267 domain-containing protein [Saccharothrix sp. S26]MCE6993949.1 hypothetical protein [Saccharothrix sp. S26]